MKAFVCVLIASLIALGTCQENGREMGPPNGGEGREGREGGEMGPMGEMGEMGGEMGEMHEMNGMMGEGELRPFGGEGGEMGEMNGMSGMSGMENHGQRHGEAEESSSEEDIDESSVGEFIEQNHWVLYVMATLFIALFCFFCNLTVCMCKEAFCRGKCKYCKCSRNGASAPRNNMAPRRQAEYTELQQV